MDAGDKRPLRITFICPPLGLCGGIRVVAIYAQKLRAMGHDVRVVAAKKTAPPLREALRSLVRGRGWPKSPKKQDTDYFDAAQVPIHVTNHGGPISDRQVPDGDVVIATWWETMEWVMQLSPAKGAKMHFMQDYETWAGNLDRVDAVCRLDAPKIVIAQWVKDLLESRFGQSPIALVPNSVDTNMFFAPPRGKQLIPTFGFNYSLQYLKGPDITLKAFALAQQTTPMKLIAFGSIPVSEQNPLPADAEYFYRAPDEKLRDIYSQCDGWLFGTRQEGFGLPILEAMACRTPVIGATAGAAPELVGQGGGILIPTENPEAMAAGMTRIAAMTETQWRDMSDKAYATVSRWTWDDAAKCFEEAVASAVASVGAGTV